MSPLDDELQALLHARAGDITPSPDPLAGIERRARGIRRRRIAASVAGTALALTGLAVVAPAALEATRTRTLPPAAPGPTVTTPPTLTSSPTPTPSPVRTASAAPDNVLRDWPTRGAMESEVLADAKLAWARSLQTTVDDLGTKILFAGDTDSGVRFVMGQAWAPGAEAAVPVSYSAGGTGGPVPFIGKANDADTAVLAFLVGDLPGTSVDLLVVVPEPGTGQVLYDEDATGRFDPVTGQDHLDGVVLVDRSTRASADRLQLLDGNGDLDNPSFEGPVAPLLCGIKSCG